MNMSIDASTISTFPLSRQTYLLLLAVLLLPLPCQTLVGDLRISLMSLLLLLIAWNIQLL